jgi:hypothetical protein
MISQDKSDIPVIKARQNRNLAYRFNPLNQDQKCAK